MTKNRIMFILSFVFSFVFWILVLIIPPYNTWPWFLSIYIAYAIFYFVIFRDSDYSDFYIMDTLGIWSTLLLVLAV